MKISEPRGGVPIVGRFELNKGGWTDGWMDGGAFVCVLWLRRLFCFFLGEEERKKEGGLRGHEAGTMDREGLVVEWRALL